MHDQLCFRHINFENRNNLVTDIECLPVSIIDPCVLFRL